MIIKALFFAHLRDVAGEPEIDVQLDSGSSVQALADELADRDIRFNGILRYARAAVNGEWATPASVLNENDEVAFLPPSSGG